MNISFPGHSSPSVGFEVPLEMLAACHLRVQDQCSTLLRLAPHIAAHGADRSAREAATAVMRYFDTSARHHHDDEEHDLFPALIESMAGSDAVCLHELTATLTREHRELEALWQAVRAVLVQVAAGQTVVLSQQDMACFAQRYEQHIAREESELLPLARRLLSDAELDRIGLVMRMRRAGTGAQDPLSADTPERSAGPANDPSS